jgi:hypothetical protein
VTGGQLLDVLWVVYSGVGMCCGLSILGLACVVGCLF